MIDWFRDNPVLGGWLLGVSGVIFAGSMVAIPLLVTRMRHDYFLNREPGPASFAGRHPVVRFTALALKNGLGVLLVIIGIAMLVLPGQGVLTMLLGISLLNFPGKRKLELKIVRQRPVLGGINWIRARARRPPLVLPPHGDGD